MSRGRLDPFLLEGSPPIKGQTPPPEPSPDQFGYLQGAVWACLVWPYDT